MNQILANILYTIMYWFGYVEIFFNRIKKFTNTCDEDEETIFLISNETLDVKIYSFIENDVDMNYDFGIVEKQIEGKICQYLFQGDLDTDNIQEMFEQSVEQCFLSVDVVVGDKTFALDISNFNYWFQNNVIFFKNHIHFLLRNQHDKYIDDEDIYTINIVDHLCNIISLNKDEYIEIDNTKSTLYNKMST